MLFFRSPAYEMAGFRFYYVLVSQFYNLDTCLLQKVHLLCSSSTNRPSFTLHRLIFREQHPTNSGTLTTCHH